MKVKNILFISLFLLIILTVGAVSACDDTNSSDIVSINDNQDVINEDLDDDVVQAADEDDDDDYDDDDDDDDGEEEHYTEVSIYIPDEIEEADDTGSIELPDDAKGKVTITINGSIATLELDTEYGMITVVKASSGAAKTISAEDETDWDISFANLPEGKYNITVEYKDNLKKNSPKYNVKETQIVIIGEVAPGGDDNEEEEDEEIEFEDSYIYHSSESVITIPQSFLPSLKVLINNKAQAIENNSGVYCVNLSQFDLGDYDILIYNDTDVLINDTFSICGVITAPLEFKYKDNAVMSLELPKKATGNLIVKKDYVVVFNQPVVNGTVSFSLSNISVGCYLFTASYDGDDYEVDDFEEEISIYPIINCPSKMNVGENKFITFEFGPDARGEVILDADMEEYGRTTLVDGKGNISLANLDDGNIELEISFGDAINGLSEVEESFEIEVLEVPPKVIGSKTIKMFYFDGTTLKATVYGTNGKFAEETESIDIQIGKRSYETSVGKNGAVSFKVPKSIAPGKYKFTITYDEASLKGALTVKHVLKLKKVKVKKSAKKVVLKATLKQGKKALKGKKVTFRFKGKKITVKTNKKGVAKVTVKKSILKKLKVGKKFTYQARYLNDKVKKSVKIKK